MSKKWYNLFVSVDQAAEGASDASQPPSDASASAAQAVADIAASVPKVTQFSGPAVANPTSFEQIYAAAEIQPPEHGYTIMKVADMLASEHLRGLPAEVKRNTILVALEAAGVKIQDVIEDAVKRDRALDTYEHVLEKSVQDLEAGKSGENAKIQAEMEQLVAEHRSRIQANDDAVAKEKERFFGWRLQKQQEEKKIADAVGYFVSQNPIATGGSPAPPPKT